MIKSWMVIGGITLLVALGTALMKPRDTKWGIQLQRPYWLFFEPAIPFIWTVIFICGAGSAILIWENEPGSLRTWLLMGIYLILEIVTVAYIPLTLRLRSLKVGLILGGVGLMLGIFLALGVLPISGLAAVLLLPYLLWSPVGTYTTWQMIQLNPEAA
ncbi:MAG TPA: TspO/MBR family protein [Leptolyngbyaceae cyanobacterium]